MADSLPYLNEDGLEEAIADKDHLVLLDFTATWCGPCKGLAPKLQDLANQHGDKVTVYKVDVDKNPKVAQRFNVRSVPTMVLFEDGKPVGQLTGNVPVSKLNTFARVG